MADRISQLPEHILHHHILSLLPQKDAVGTCTLSKSWRHLGPTRPKLEFDYRSFPGEKQQLFLPLVKNTLQRYVHQNLQIQDFILGVRDDYYSESISLLDEWIPKIIMNLGVKTFDLRAYCFSLPSVVFRAEFLEELKLSFCKLDQIKNCIVKLQVLKRLSLHDVYMEEETFEKIMASCPLIQHLVLDSCTGLRAIRVNKAHNLKHFDCHINRNYHCIGSIEIEDDAPESLETIHINNCQNWYLNKNNNYIFLRLKSLYLWNVQLTTELLNNLSSNNFPCLEDLQLHHCTGFTEINLSNRSIKRLVIRVPCCPIKLHIDAPNMLYFEYRGGYPLSFSFTTTTSRELESHIEVWPFDSTAGVKLNEFLKALSQSRISLHISRLHWRNQDTTSCCDIWEPVVVEHLCLCASHSFDELPAFFNCLFRICRPRYVGLALSDTDSYKGYEREFMESMWKTLVNKGGTRQCHFWQHELEETSIQAWDENTNEWHRVHLCEFSINQSIRFLLKWRN